MECQQIGSSKNLASSQQSFQSRLPENLNNKSNAFGHDSKKPTSNKSLNANIKPSPIIIKEVGLKRQMKFNSNKCQETSPQAAEKRPSDHENLDKKKITKIKKCEDSSKNIIDKKSKTDLTKAAEANTMESKFSLILDSYTALGNKLAPSEKETKNKTEKSYQVKETFNINRKNNKFSNAYKKGIDLKVQEKEREIKDKEKMKQAAFSSPKTKLQARLQKIKTDMKDKQKRLRKESSKDQIDIPKDDISNFIESMDWEPSNDLIVSIYICNLTYIYV